MSRRTRNTTGKDEVRGQKSPRAVTEVLRSMNAARKMIGLYGEDHPNTINCVEALAETLAEFVSSFGRATCVFTKQGIVVNDCYYSSSSESEEMLRRLRARGVMAITFVGAPSAEQVKAFAAFLNAEPREVRQQGGPSAYLSSRGVSRIITTESVYTAADDGEGNEDAAVVEIDADDTDRVIGALVDWLCKHDDERGEAPRLPICRILSEPDTAAKLIREAVTKLHASRRRRSAGDLAAKVVHDLEEVASSTAEEWSAVASQVRKAVSRLPRDMREQANIFAPYVDAANRGPKEGREAVKTDEVEGMVAELLQGTAGWQSAAGFDFSPIDRLFGAEPAGVLSRWQSEMAPASLVRSTGSSCAALLSWETSAAEHARIADALAALIPSALQLGDAESAVLFAGELAGEARRDAAPDWRSTNARSALQKLEPTFIRSLVEEALGIGTYRAREVADSLLEIVPGLAPSLLDLLGTSPDDAFAQSVRRGVVRMGQAAVPALGQMLRSGSAVSSRVALETLVEMGTDSALKQIAAFLEESDRTLAALGVRMLSRVRTPLSVEICTGFLSHHSPEVRCAAMRALGELSAERAVGYLARIAGRSGLRSPGLEERVAAVQALGRIGSQEALACLRRVVQRRPLLGRRRYEAVRAAARQALAQSETCQDRSDSLAA